MRIAREMGTTTVVTSEEEKPGLWVTWEEVGLEQASKRETPEPLGKGKS